MGAPCSARARSTISMARSTPAQKPRGLASSKSINSSPIYGHFQNIQFYLTFLDQSVTLMCIQGFFSGLPNHFRLLLTTDWPDPFLSGMIFPLSAKSVGRAFHQSRRCNRIEMRPVHIALFAMRLIDIRRAFCAQGAATVLDAALPDSPCLLDPGPQVLALRGTSQDCRRQSPS